MTPRVKARLAGVCELFEGIASTFGQTVVPRRLVMAGDPATTAANILGHPRLYWIGFASNIAAVGFHIFWIMLFFDLLRPVSKRISVLAAVVGLAGCAIQLASGLLYGVPFFLVERGNAERVVRFLTLNVQTFNIYLAMFGVWCVLSGYLISRSTFLPRILGVLLAIDGIGWMTFFWPPLGRLLFPGIAVVAALAELPLQVCLIVAGVNNQRWRVQVASAV